MFRHILVVDAEEALRDELTLRLAAEGHPVATVANGAEALAMLTARTFDAVFCAVPAPDAAGMDAIARLVRRFPDLPVIATCPADASEIARRAADRGASDVLIHPYAPESIRMTLRRVMQRTHLLHQSALLHRELTRSLGERAIVAASDRMIELLEQVEQAASCDAAVLLTGERGTGKEVLARAIHAQSLRREGPFVTIHCGSSGPDLLEVELFGGATTPSAHSVRIGGSLFAAAHRGTLYLDEIADLTPHLQDRLLAAMRDEAIHPVGGDKTLAVDVRLMVATTRDLDTEAQAGRFDQDLLARLAAARLEIPPLRSRRKDIPLLVDHFLAHHREALARPVRRVSDEALERLVAHDWPGNVRELENLIERAVIVATSDVIGPAVLDSAITPDHAFPPAESERESQREDLSMRSARRRFEADLIRRALARTGGNRTHAARLLEISHRALLYKLKEYEIRN